MKRLKCKCSDKGCPIHNGKAECYEKSDLLLYRIDQVDEVGTAMCDGCADDAMESGVFDIETADCKRRAQ